MKWVIYGMFAVLAASAAADPPTVFAESLDVAWSAALAADQRVQAARERVEAAHCNHAAAARRYRPSISSKTGYLFLSDSPSFVFANNTFPIVDTNFVATGTTAKMPLYTGGQIQNAADAASCQANAATWNVQRTILDVKLAVATAYVGVLRADRGVEVAQSTVASLEAHERAIGTMLRRGEVPKNDLLAAEVSVADAKQQEIRARNRLATAKATYNRLLVRPLNTPVDLDELETPPTSGDLDALAGQAVGMRPELAALAAQVNSLRFQAESVLGAVKPQVGVEGGYVLLDSAIVDPKGVGMLMFGLQWTPYDGGVSRARANALRHDASAVMRMRNDMTAEIGLDVQNAWLNEQETRQRIEVTSKAIEQAEENLRANRVRFSQGAAINTEVLDAEALRTRTYSNYYDAVYDAVLATLRLRRAVGIL